MLVAATDLSFSSGKPATVPASIVTISSDNPILANNKPTFMIYEYATFNSVYGASYLLTPLTKIYFTSSITGTRITFDSTTNPIKLELFLIEAVVVGVTYEGVRLDGMGTSSEKFVTDGITNV
jgi:hypothetical protein